MERSKYSHKSPEEKALEIEKFMSEMTEEIKKYTVDENSIKELLDWQSQFYNYSLGNMIMINKQFPGAEAVGSFVFWSQHGYRINQGEKGLMILRPYKNDYFFRTENEPVALKNATKEEKEKIKSGEIKLYQGKTNYGITRVFDISQTNCPVADIPKLFPNRWLEGDIKDYGVFYEGVKRIATDMKVQIIDSPSELGAAKGVSYTGKNAIAVNPRNSELQNAKTLIHELAHQKLHGPGNKLTAPEKEFQAELTAYTVCKHFGIDTSEYSLKYIHDWTKGHEDIMDTQKLITGVSQCSRYFMDIMATDELMQQKYVEVAKEEIFEKKDVRQIDRLKNSSHHIFQHKTTNECFIGEKLENGQVKQASKNMNLQEARDIFKEMNSTKSIEKENTLEMEIA